MSNVYLARVSSSASTAEIEDKIRLLIKKSDLLRVVTSNDLTAVKCHFGEEGNSTYLPANYIKQVVEAITKVGARPFVTDTNVLYKSRRDNSYDHLQLAREHGFSHETLQAPVIIADGIKGKNEKEILIEAPQNRTVFIASDYVDADSLIVITHATGHLATGLGATIKNLGMGMASRKGKLRQHSVSHPLIDAKNCTACEKCLQWCPSDAIKMVSSNSGNKHHYAQINDEDCIGCGECLATCRMGAVKFKWDSSSKFLQQQIVEHALGIVKIKKDKMAYLTFLVQMTKDCDCLPQAAEFVVEDIGILAGFDPVALDQAVLDLTTRKNGKDNLATLSYAAHDPSIQLEYGEQVGLGQREYQL